MNPFDAFLPPLSDSIAYSIKNTPHLSPKKFGVFDFETTPIKITKKQNFLLGGVYVYNKLFISDSIPSIINFMVQSETKIFFAHNMGYDFRFMFDYIKKNYNFEIIPAGSDTLQVKIKNDSCLLFELRDSMKIFNASLFKFCESFNKFYFKKNLDLSKINYNKYNPEHRIYLHNDCFGLYEALSGIFDFLGV